MIATKVLNYNTRSIMHLRSCELPKELSKMASSLLSSTPEGGKHVLPDLTYDYNALEPVISSETMTLHHSKHHNAYVTNLNTALEKLDTAVSSGDVAGIIGLQGALNLNGGGHLNHTLFWENLFFNIISTMFHICFFPPNSYLIFLICFILALFRQR